MAGSANLLMALMSSGAPGVVNLPSNIAAGSVGGSGSFEIESDGDILENGADSGNDWVTPAVAGIGNHYQVIYRDVTGDTGSLTGAVDTWLDLSSDRTWSLPPGDVGVTGTIAIRVKGTGIELDSCLAQIINTTV